MKPSISSQNKNLQTPKTPNKGLNRTIKNSVIFFSNNSRSPVASSHQQHSIPQKNFVSRSQNYIQNPTTTDNSLAKNNKTNKSLIKINLLQSTSTNRKNSHSQQRKKKFISITQRENSNGKIQSFQHKQSNLITKREKNFQQNQLTQNSPFKRFKQMLPQPTTLRHYWTNMIDSISNKESKDKSESIGQQHVLNEDIFSGKEQFSLAQKARLQRRNMMNSFIMPDQNKNTKQRVHTQMFETTTKRRDYLMATEPECTIDSRNFIVHERRIGENTLTRKDSLILALMQQLQSRDDINQSKQLSSKQNQYQQYSPITLQSYKTKDSSPLRQKASLKSMQNEVLTIQTEKLKQKAISMNEQIKKSSNKKINRIKCISLIQKQQQYRYKNTITQNQLIKDKFIQLKNKNQQNKK